MGVVLLVRHGQASAGSADYDQLSDLGRTQASLVGRRLVGSTRHPARVVHGSLARQRDTAALLVAELAAAPERVADDARLDEYDHLGVFAVHAAATGTTRDFTTMQTPEDNRAVQANLDEAIVRWMAQDDERYAETHAAFVERSMRSIEAMTRLPGISLVISSSGVIGVAVARALGLPTASWPALARMIVNASLTTLITGGTGTNLLTFNDHAHLEHDRGLITYR